MHICVALALLGCTRGSSAADLIEAVHNAKAALQFASEEHAAKYAHHLELIRQATRVVETFDRVAAWVSVSTNGQSVSVRRKSGEGQDEKLWEDGPILAPGEIVWAYSGSDSWWPGQVRRLKRDSVEVDFWNQEYATYKMKHIKPFAEHFDELSLLNGEKESFQQDLLDALEVFAADVVGLHEVLADNDPPKRYKLRLTAIRQFMQRWIQQYTEDARIAATLIAIYKPPKPVMWIDLNAPAAEEETKPVSSGINSNGTDGNKRGSGSSVGSTPKRAKQAADGSPQPAVASPAPELDAPDNVQDMVQMLLGVQSQQRGRRRPAAKKSVASALKANNVRRLFKVLLEGAVATDQDMLDAVHSCSVDVVELLLRTSDFNVTRYERGFTLLHYVAKLNRAELVPLMVDVMNEAQKAWGGKPAVRLVDNHKRTALHIAAEAGSLDALQSLLDAGADLEARDKDGNTPLLWCTASDKPTNVRTAVYLIRRGANVFAADYVGRDSLFWSINYGHVHLSKELLQFGARMGTEITEAFVKDMSLGHERFPVTLDPRPMEVVRREIIDFWNKKHNPDEPATNSEEANSPCDADSDSRSSVTRLSETDLLLATVLPGTSVEFAMPALPPSIATADEADLPVMPHDQTAVDTRKPSDASTSEQSSTPSVAESEVPMQITTVAEEEEEKQEQQNTKRDEQHHEEKAVTLPAYSAERPVPQFIYARDCVAPDYLDADPNDYDPKVEKPCGCMGDCLWNIRCPCVKKNGERFPYKHGLLDFERTTLHECGKHCGCSEFCSLRKSQQGLNVPVVVCWTGSRGWGVLAKANIDRGHFVCCYTGEVISPEERDEREAQKAENAEQANADFCTYALSYEKGSSELIIDGEVVGNVSRFFNHSCSSNLIVKPVDAGGRYLRLAFFANRAIQAGEELTWNYSQGVKKRRSEKAIRCCCGEQYCREYL